MVSAAVTSTSGSSCISARNSGFPLVRGGRAPGLRWRFLSVLYRIFKEMIGILDRIPEDISRIMVTNKPEGDGSSPAGWKAVYDAHGPVPRGKEDGKEV